MPQVCLRHLSHSATRQSATLLSSPQLRRPLLAALLAPLLPLLIVFLSALLPQLSLGAKLRERAQLEQTNSLAGELSEPEAERGPK